MAVLQPDVILLEIFNCKSILLSSEQTSGPSLENELKQHHAYHHSTATQTSDNSYQQHLIGETDFQKNKLPSCD